MEDTTESPMMRDDPETTAYKAFQDIERQEALEYLSQFSVAELKKLMDAAATMTNYTIPQEVIDASVDQAIKVEDQKFYPKVESSAFKAWKEWEDHIFNETRKMTQEHPDWFFEGTESLDTRVCKEADRIRLEAENMLITHFGPRVQEFLDQVNAKKWETNAARRRDMFLDWYKTQDAELMAVSNGPGEDQEELFKRLLDVTPTLPSEEYPSPLMTEWDQKLKHTYSPSELLEEEKEQSCPQQTKTE